MLDGTDSVESISVFTTVTVYEFESFLCKFSNVTVTIEPITYTTDSLTGIIEMSVKLTGGLESTLNVIVADSPSYPVPLVKFEIVGPSIIYIIMITLTYYKIVQYHSLLGMMVEIFRGFHTVQDHYNFNINFVWRSISISKTSLNFFATKMFILSSFTHMFTDNHKSPRTLPS